MASTADKVAAARRKVEEAYAHPSPDVYAIRLSFVGASIARRSIATAARLAGFQVALYGAIGHDMPSWTTVEEQRVYGSTRRTSFALSGARPGMTALGLEAFYVVWIGSAAPSARVRFVGWPWRNASATEVKSLLAYHGATIDP